MKSSCVVESAPHRLDYEHSTLFTPAALKFLQTFIDVFDDRVDQLMLKRARRRVDIFEGKWKPAFRTVDASLDQNWAIDEIPKRLRNRKLDLGDVSPANTVNFIDAMYADVQGIQVSTIRIRVLSWKSFNIFGRLILTMGTVPHGATRFKVFTMLRLPFIHVCQVLLQI